jgi:hypothetical protein
VLQVLGPIDRRWNVEKMDPQVPVLLERINALGKTVTEGKLDQTHATQRELLAASEKLCIALQHQGQLVENVIFAVGRPRQRQNVD